MTPLDAGWRLPPDAAALLARVPDAGALSDDERARAAAFAGDRRRQFVLGRTAARALAARRLGCAPASVALTVGADGAPEVPGLRVSIAHAGRGAAALGAAVVADRPVGIDVEAVGPRHPDLWRRILTDEERPALDALGGPSSDAQTLLWALKEAVLKGQRTGLRAGARSVRLSLGADGAPLERGGATAESDRSGRWRLRYGRVGRGAGLWLAVAWASDD